MKDQKPVDAKWLFASLAKGIAAGCLIGGLAVFAYYTCEWFGSDFDPHDRGAMAGATVAMTVSEGMRVARRFMSREASS